MPMRIEYEGTINNGRSHVEDHDNFVGRLSANPVEGPYYRGTSDPVGDTYTETNKDRHCSQGSQCSGVMWRLTKHSRKGGTTWIFNQTWETRCPFSSEIDGTGYFCERDW